nr:phage tail protein [Escherichia coli]
MANFYSIITNRGKELEAEALASGTKITLVKFVVGDGNGQATQPKPTQTKLVNEKYRGDIADLSVSPEQSTQMMAKIVLPTEVGGFTVREIGILTDAGELYAVANCAAIEKPVGGVSVNMQFRLAVSDTANITLNVATGDGLFLRIDQDLSEIRGRGAQAQKAARESLAVVDASTKQKGLVQLSSATNSTSETQAATPAALKAVKDDSLAKDQNGADIPNKPAFIENLGLNDTVNKAASALPIIKKVLSVDLNTLGHIDHAGVYYQSSDVNATADKHYPIQLSGTLLVTPSAYGCQQEYTTHSTSRKFLRSLSGVWNGSGPWSPWVEVYSESHKPSAHDVGSISTARQMLSNGINQDGVASNNLNNVTPNSTAFIYSGTLNNTSGRNLVLFDYMNQQFDQYRVQLGFGHDSGGGVFGRTKNGDNSSWNGMFEFYTTAKKPTPSEVGAVPSAGGSVGYLDNAKYYDTKPDIEPRGSGAFNTQLNSGAPFNAPDWAWTVNPGGHYVPLVKGASTRAGIGYPCAVSFGYLLPGDDTWAIPIIHAKGDNSECTWEFNINTGEILSSKAGGMSTQTYAQERANEAREQAKTWAYQNLVSKVQVSDVQEYIDIPYPGQTYPPAGASISVIDGATKSTGSGISFHISRIYFRRLQHVINGIPYNIA